MADNDEGQTSVPEPVKTVTDLQIEKLNARLDALEAENKELKTANKGLWAQLHPVEQVQPVATIPTGQTPVPSTGGDLKVLSEQLGLKME